MSRFTLVVLALLVTSLARAETDERAPPSPPRAVDPSDVEQGPSVDDPPASEVAPPVDVPAPSDAVDAPADGDPPVTLRFSREADAKLAACVPLVAARADTEARACLDEVLRFGDDTTAALRASALVSVLDAEPPPPPPLDGGAPGPVEPGDDPRAGARIAIPPGRLELSSTAGLFGVWNGIAAGIAVAPHLPSANPAGLILGTGALAVGLGVGYGVGGYFLADALDLGEGDSRLVASSLVWGTTFGIAALPAILDVLRPEGDVALTLSLGTVVASGFALGGASLALATFTDFTTPHVSLINTGGWVGGLFGLLTIASLAPYAPPLPAYSAGYLTVAGSGLLLGALSGMVLDLSWGETLLLDLGGVLGTVTAAAIVMSVTASGAVNGVPSTVLIPTSSAITAAGTLGGIGLGLAATTLFRGEGSSVFKSFGEGITMLPPAPAFVVDKDGALAPMMFAPTLVF